MKKANLFIISIFLFFIVSILSLSFGAVQINFMDIAREIIGKKSLSTAELTIIWQLRLPRLILALVVGASLGISGAVLQALLRNPLADPYVLGISSGAAVGIAVGTLLGVFSWWGIPVFAFIGAIFTMFLVYLIAYRHGQLPTLSLVLGGIIINALFSSLIMLILAFADHKMQAIMFWLMGNIGVVDSRLLILASLILFFGFLGSMLFYREINIIISGEETAISLGVEVNKVKRILLLFVSVLTSMAVALSGIIGFVGLIVPHIVKIFLGSNHKLIMPASAITGAILLVISDLLARTIVAPSELPVGVITALVGAPFFIFIIKRYLK